MEYTLQGRIRLVRLSAGYVRFRITRNPGHFIILYDDPDIQHANTPDTAFRC